MVPLNGTGITTLLFEILGRRPPHGGTVDRNRHGISWVAQTASRSTRANFLGNRVRRTRLASFQEQ
jgi:ABC-type Mn2+/Zn2+ transport system ATPase subunit